MCHSASRQSSGNAVPDGVIITHPNRDKPVVQATRGPVVLLLLASAALGFIGTVGGRSGLAGGVPVEVAYVPPAPPLASFAGPWTRGVLPVSAVPAVLLLIFALVAGPGWFD